MSQYRNIERNISTNSAFTLLEIAVVLVIIGLVVGGIMVGQTMIRTARMEHVISELSRYTAAVNTFRGKYQGLPGDLQDAEAYWGSDSSCPGTAFNTTPKTATCNGDGNERIGVHQSGSNCREIWRAWQQLADAKLISGEYSGVGTGDGSGTACIGEPGVSMPNSIVSNASWYILTFNSDAANLWPTGYFPGYYGNGFAFGNLANNTISPVISPSDAYLIDTKLDDGIAGSGTVVSPMAAYTPDCLTTSDPSTAQYNLTSTDITCALFFRHAF